jgi:arginyl-tRNA--protein-N-Asp/Glu arginylyltransferase
MTTLSQVQLAGPQKDDCGYCKTGTSRSFYISASSLDCADYQALIDHGFRRSGSLAYVFDNATTCCPAYTIRLRVANFAPSKEQVRLVRRFNAYLRGEVASVQGGGGGGGGGGAPPEAPREPAPDPVAAVLERAMRALVQLALPAAAAGLGDAPLVCVAKGGGGGGGALGGGRCRYSSAAALRAAAALRRAGTASMSDGRGGGGGGGGGSGCGAATPQGACDALLRAAAAAAAAPPADAAAAAALFPLYAPGARVLLLAAPTGHVNFSLEGGAVVPAPGAPPLAPPEPAAPPLPPPPEAVAPPPPPPPAGARRVFSVTSVPAQFQEDSFRLWQRYQAAVHGDDPSELSRRSFTRFLCESPLVRAPWGGPPPPPPPAAGGAAAPPSDPLARAEAALARAWAEGEGDGAGVPLRCGGDGGGAASAGGGGLSWLCGFPADADAVFPDLLSQPAAPGGLLAGGYGTFHHRYTLDGALVAVGVVDVLPNCLSSVYAFYDPDLAKTVPLGKLTALREVQWVQAVRATASPRLRSYYLGLYLPTCAKMRYKAEYAPAELLCPATRCGWAPLEGAVGALAGARAPCLLPPAEEAAWLAAAKEREAALGGALARLPLRVGGEVRPAGALAALGSRCAPFLALLRNEWLALAGTSAGARVMVLA